MDLLTNYVPFGDVTDVTTKRSFRREAAVYGIKSCEAPDCCYYDR